MFIINTKSGKIVAKFEWKKSPKESIKSIKFSPDEKFCMRLVICNNPKDINSIEVYKDGNFSKPFSIVQSRFATKGA